MTRKGQRRPSVDSRRLARGGARLFVESLESRALLSTVSPVEVMTPAVSVITPDRGRPPGGFGGGGFGGGGITNPTPYSTAVTPAQLGKAYGLSETSSDGAGTTIAIVDAYNDPNIQADLAAFDAQYSLPAASLTVVNENGQTTGLPATDAGWSLEIAMDVEWAHAAAPGAKIVLVEASSASTTDLMTAVQTAAKSANVVSMSWGGSEFSGQTAYDTAAYFANPNVTFVASSGDSAGSGGASWPASSPYVLSVGGTTLSLSSSGGYGSETSWSTSGSYWSGYGGSGGGVSSVESLPSYQASALGSSYAKGRVTPDVSLDANPSTGLSVYNSVPGSGQTGWFQVGGTSAGSPVWAGLVAAADSARAANHLAPLGTSQTLNLLYGLYGTTASPSSSYAKAFHDVTAGANLAGKAGTGYDLVTGLGTPVGSSIIAAAAKYGSAASVTKSVVVATPAVATTTTTTTVATPHALAVVSPPAVAAAVTTVSAFQPLGPVTTTAATPQTQPSTTLNLVELGRLAAPSSRPVQPLSQRTPDLFLSATEEEPVKPATEIPRGPGLFLDPVEPLQVGEEAPALVAGPMAPWPVWDAALESVAEEGAWGPATGLAGSPVPAEESESDRYAGVSGAAMAGLAVAVWGTWEYRSRRSDRERSRGRWLSAPSTN